MIHGLTRTLFTVALLACLAQGCGGPPSAPEEELRAWVARGIEAAENKERRELMEMVAAGYVDARGNERDDIEGMLRVYFLRQNRIALLPKIEEITIYDETAGKIVMMPRSRPSTVPPSACPAAGASPNRLPRCPSPLRCRWLHHSRWISTWSCWPEAICWCPGHRERSSPSSFASSRGR